MFSKFGREKRRATDALLDVVEKGDVEAVKRMLDQGVDLRGTRSKESKVEKAHLPRTAISVAMWLDHVEIVRLLCQQGAADRLCYRGMRKMRGLSTLAKVCQLLGGGLEPTTISVAIWLRRPAVLKELLTCHNNKGSKDTEHCQALNVAIFVGDSAMLKMLLEAIDFSKIATLSLRMQWSKHALVFWGDELVLYLAQRGALDLNPKKALWDATILAQPRTIALLLRTNGASIIAPGHCSRELIPNDQNWVPTYGNIIECAVQANVLRTLLSNQFFQPDFVNIKRARLWLKSILLLFSRKSVPRDVQRLVLSCEHECALTTLSAVLGRFADKKCDRLAPWSIQAMALVRQEVQNQRLLTRKSIVEVFLADFLVKQRDICRHYGVSVPLKTAKQTRHAISLSLGFAKDEEEETQIVELGDRSKPMLDEYNAAKNEGWHSVISVGIASLSYQAVEQALRGSRNGRFFDHPGMLAFNQDSDEDGWWP